MKKMLKKTNRGLLLSGIVLVVLVVYISYDYISFNSQKEKIRSMITNYYNEAYEINTSFTTFSDSEKKDAQNLIEKYWCEGSNTLFEPTTKSIMLKNIDELFSKSSQNSSITDAKTSVKSMKIQKSGTGYASVTAAFSTSVSGLYYSLFLTPSSCNILSENDHSIDFYDENYFGTNNIEDDYSEAEMSQSYKDKSVTLVYDFEVTIQVKKEADGWKILAIYGYVTDSNLSLNN